MRQSLLLTLLLTILAPALLAAQLQAAASGAGLRPGDVIRLATWRLPEFTGEYRVGSDGEILHPLLAEVRVTGLTEPQIRERVLEVLRRYETDPQVVIDLLHRVAVTGEVSLPNVYMVPPETTIAQAVATAGGPTRSGSLRRISVLRDGTETVVNLQRADAAVLGMRIRSGDEVRVARQADLFRDYVVPSATLVSALAAIATLLAVR